MKKNTIFTLIITLALLLSNLSAVFANDGSIEEPITKETKEVKTSEASKSSQRAQPEIAPQPAQALVKAVTPKQVETSKAVVALKSDETPVEEEIEVFQDNDNTEEVDFSKTELPENWEMGGDAELTGDGAIDPEGDGWLRLTGEGGYGLGYAVYDEALATENGLAFQFDYTAWGGSGADGIAFFLMDGETTMEDFNIGGAGGSLGYAPRHKTTKGLSNAVLGIGLDEFGNFANSGEGRNGGHGRTQDSVTIRGAGDGFEGYEFVEGTDKLKEGVDIRDAKERPDQTGEDYRNVSILFKPAEKQYSLTLKIQFGADSEPKDLFTNLLLPGVIPATVKFGFTAASGNVTNYHEIRNLIIDKSVLNDAVEEAQKPSTKKKAQKTVTVPVTAVQTGNTLTIIPVTGSEMVALSCSVQSKLEIKDQAFAILPALCDQQASLAMEAIETMPDELPAAFTFVKAANLSIIDSDSTDTGLSAGEQIEVGFYLDDDLASRKLSILVWESGEWVEKEVEISDGVITTTINTASVFVLVQK